MKKPLLTCLGIYLAGLLFCIAFTLLCCSVTAQTLNIPSGINNAVYKIPDGNYSGANLNNVGHDVKIIGGPNVKISGTIIFQGTGHDTLSDIKNMSKVTFTELKGVGYAFINLKITGAAAGAIWNNNGSGAGITLAHVSIINDSFINTQQIWQGSYNQFDPKQAYTQTGGVDSFNYRNNYVENMLSPGVGIRANKMTHFLIDHNRTINSQIIAKGTDNGLYSIEGNGTISNEFAKNLYAWFMRVIGYSVKGEGDPNIRTVNNIYVGSFNYGFGDCRSDNSPNGANIHVLNNTAGNLNRILYYVAPVALAYDMDIYTLEVKNNFAYNNGQGQGTSNSSLIVNNVENGNKFDTANNNYAANANNVLDTSNGNPLPNSYILAKGIGARPPGNITPPPPQVTVSAIQASIIYSNNTMVLIPGTIYSAVFVTSLGIDSVTVHK